MFVCRRTRLYAEILEIFSMYYLQAGIGAAYLDRWCIDPLDAECPKSAPNGFDSCAALQKFQAWNVGKPMDEQVHLEAEELPKEDTGPPDGTMLNKILGLFFSRKSLFGNSASEN